MPRKGVPAVVLETDEARRGDEIIVVEQIIPLLTEKELKKRLTERAAYDINISTR